MVMSASSTTLINKIFTILYLILLMLHQSQYVVTKKTEKYGMCNSSGSKVNYKFAEIFFECKFTRSLNEKWHIILHISISLVSVSNCLATKL